MKKYMLMAIVLVANCGALFGEDKIQQLESGLQEALRAERKGKREMLEREYNKELKGLQDKLKDKKETLDEEYGTLLDKSDALYQAVLEAVEASSKSSLTRAMRIPKFMGVIMGEVKKVYGNDTAQLEKDMQYAIARAEWVKNYMKEHGDLAGDWLAQVWSASAQYNREHPRQ